MPPWPREKEDPDEQLLAEGGVDATCRREASSAYAAEAARTSETSRVADEAFRDLCEPDAGTLAAAKSEALRATALLLLTPLLGRRPATGAEAGRTDREDFCFSDDVMVAQVEAELGERPMSDFRSFSATCVRRESSAAPSEGEDIAALCGNGYPLMFLPFWVFPLKPGMA